MEDEDEDDNAEDGVEDDKVEGDDVEKDDVEEEEDDDVETDDVEEEEEDDDVEGEDRSQDCGPHFVRACAVEMHANISHEPLFRKFAGKMPRTRLSTERGHTLWGSLRGRNACQDFTRATL